MIVSLKIPLGSGKFPIVKLPGPCIYCEKPVNPDGFTWVGTLSFPLMKWGVSNKFGDHQIYPVKVNGVPKMGSVRIEAPYCAGFNKR